MKSKLIMQSNKMETGTQYTLTQLFSGDKKIIIPDLQRDYCWGTTTSKDGSNLVQSFVRNIINNGFRQNETDLNLGLLYGYEAPAHHIQLCDGQQRITTLFLLLGMLNKQTGSNAFQNQLISYFELKDDDREPYLQYAIRESSLYFLSDLVTQYFLINDNISVDEISKQPWYFGEYNLDPSIQSILAAMKIIEQEVKDIDANAFGKYIVEKLSFLYYNMGDRKKGEETFVIINTTGEPLSATENLKPLLIGNITDEEKRKNASILWEKWETWFWQHRKGAGKQENDTADNGLNEFFRWVGLLNFTPESVQAIQKTGIINAEELRKIDDDYMTFINNYFEIVYFLFNEKDGFFKNNLNWLAPLKKGNEQISWFRLLPVIEYIKRFGTQNQRNILRVKTFFKNIARVDKVSKAVGDLLPKAIQLIKDLPNSDIASMLEIEKVSEQILTAEERLKFELYLAADNRVEMEDNFWEAENHKIWNGEIIPLLQWPTDNEGFKFDKFKQYYKTFLGVFIGECDANIDITRRALLTRNLKKYPKIFRGDTNYSFGWEYSDWKKLINENREQFKLFFDELSGADLQEKQQKMIDDFDELKDWAEFVKIPKLIKYCKQKNIQWHGDKGWALIKEVKATTFANLKSYRLHLDFKKDNFFKNEQWEVGFYPQGRTCVFFKKRNDDRQVGIDVLHTENDKYKLELFSHNETSNAEQFLKDVAEKFSLKFGEDNRYNSELKSRDEIYALTKELIEDLS